MRTSNDRLGNHVRKGTPPLRAAPESVVPPHPTTPSDSGPSDSGSIVVVESRRLVRESLVHCIRAHIRLDLIGVQNIDEWMELGKTREASLFVLDISACSSDDGKRMVQRTLEVAKGVPTAVLSDEQDLTNIGELLRYGVRGCIPTDLSLNVVIAAFELIRAGGTFVPAVTVMKASAPAVTRVEPSAVIKASAPAVMRAELPAAYSPKGVFTARQVAVVNQLRLGKPNKVIAYTLAMRESTVKVHVRNIMKKINARNRTEVAILTNQMLKQSEGA